MQEEGEDEEDGIRRRDVEYIGFHIPNGFFFFLCVVTFLFFYFLGGLFNIGRGIWVWPIEVWPHLLS